MYYLIDSENVQNQGLNGVESLTEKDTVEIFYSAHFNSVHIEITQKLLRSKANIIFTHVSCDHANALDFQLVTKLFCMIDPDICYVIISKDKGYDCAITMAASQGYMNVRRAESIQAASSLSAIETAKPAKKPEPVQEKQKSDPVQSTLNHFRDKCKLTLSKDEAKFLLDAIKESQTKAVFYNQFTKAFGMKNGNAFYKKVKTEYDWLKRLTK